MSIALDVAKIKHDAYLATRCKLANVVANLSTDDKEAAEYAIEQGRAGDRMFSNAQIAKLLTDNGYPIGKTVVSDHLARRCACVRSQ